MSRDFLIMSGLALTVLGISIASLVYISVVQPDYLRSDRDGVPFYTPPVINPDGGEPVEMGELIRHYKGE
ncbi:hypothetical protein [Sedimenticola hydrogenitrophicus]|uniref:hypothetical protein n=1 Tax=Sedimenticola hydrogenitrophicus TaxID=2967975 RepID=UPI0023B01F95|nr:hypothetical protein [Sedimenticola hydrogenitrophicus]